MMRAIRILLLLIAVPFLCSGCSDLGSILNPPPSTGGAADMAHARDVIVNGGVPNPASITVEGLLADHDIGLPAPVNPGDLFTNTALAWNQDFDELTPLITIQIGFGTTLTAGNFHRKPLNLGLVLDFTASMNASIDERTGTTRLQAMLIAIDHVLAQLNANDLIGVVVFADQPTTLLRGASGDNPVEVKRVLDGLTATGLGDPSAALQQAFALVHQYRDTTRADRLLVFTDAAMIKGSAAESNFINVMQQFAGEDIGATIFGMGVDLGGDFAFDVSQVSGGNFVALTDYDRIVEVFDQDFDILVAPAASNVDLEVSVPFELDMVDAFGLPSSADPLTHLIELRLPTFFLTANPIGGANMEIRVRAGSLVDFTKTIDVAQLVLTYDNDAGDRVTSTTHLSLPANLSTTASPPYFSSPVVHKTILLINTALALKHACQDAFGITGLSNLFNSGSQDTTGRQLAVTRLTEFLTYFDGLAAGLIDTPEPPLLTLADERALVVKLLSNVQQ
ncbi:MAG: VWA domain-containing protein [Planctomycetes bacterium]|nr:VWA domain-containing protein [Planctomycetota bacterium]